jgi:hypothetical protein
MAYSLLVEGFQVLTESVEVPFPLGPALTDPLLGEV